MNRNKILNITLSFVLVIQAVFLQFALPNLVLCFGSDGHIAFEWQLEEKLYSQKNFVDYIIFNNSENEYAGTPEADCTDVDLRFRPSFANKIQKKKHSIFAAKIFSQHNVWPTKKAPKYTKDYFQCITPFEPIIKAAKSTILLI